MSPERKVDVPVYDLSLIRGIWEVRTKKYKLKQNKEKERVEKSALARIERQWQFRIHCKAMKSKERNQLHHYLERSTVMEIQPDKECTDIKQLDQEILHDQMNLDPNKLVFQLDGDSWMDFPKELQWRTYLQEWHVKGTKIRQLPDYLRLFDQLTILEIPKNAITELPPEIGKLTELRKLNASYNRLSRVPPELGDCEKLEKLELTGNHLVELPFELNNLKKLVHLDIAENMFVSIPICALRMTSLQVLDISNNKLTDLPQDMDRLEQLVSLFVHKNHFSYLPHCLTSIKTLKMIVVSGDELNSIPTKLCQNPEIKFIRLYDNPTSEEQRKKKEEEEKKKKEEEKRRRWIEQKVEVKDSGEKEFMEAYISSLENRDTVPCATTKISISCVL